MSVLWELGQVQIETCILSESGKDRECRNRKSYLERVRWREGVNTKNEKEESFFSTWSKEPWNRNMDFRTQECHKFLQQKLELKKKTSILNDNYWTMIKARGEDAVVDGG